MGKWREETRELECGCKVGRSGGPWFFDYYCEKHLKYIRPRGRFCIRKADKLLHKTNKNYKLGKLKFKEEEK